MRIGVIGARNLINFNGIDAQITYLDKENGGELFRPDILVLNGCGDEGVIDKWVNTLRPDGAAAINADIKKLYAFLPRCGCPVLTYGFSPKACVSASSVKEEAGISMQICVLRSFENFAGERVLQQEFPVNLPGGEASVSDILASVTVSLLCGGS